MMQVNLGTAPRHFYISNRGQIPFSGNGKLRAHPLFCFMYFVLLAEFGGKGEEQENKPAPRY